MIVAHRLIRSTHRSLIPSRLSILLTIVAILIAPALHAQTATDGIFVAKKTLWAGNTYSHDSWDHYWEGSLNRTNGNIGTVSTQTATWSGTYGLIKNLNIIGSVPYVWTHASQGVLHGQSGFQDITLAAKYQAIELPVKSIGSIRAIGVFTTSLPLTDYTPDLQPLSLGTHSRRAGGRTTLNYQGKNGLYINGTAGYLWRGNVKLDRPYYYTDGQLYLSNTVAMPNVFDYIISAGYRRGLFMLIGNLAIQQTRGGGDIRRQDLPFVSNRVNFSKSGLTLLTPLPRLHNLQATFDYSNTFEGRNLGQSNTFSTGLMYTVHFGRQIAQ